MTRLNQSSFVNRHAFQAAPSPALSTLPALLPADRNGDGVVAGAVELTDAYSRLLALQPGAVEFDDADNGPAGTAYRAFATTLRQATGVEPRLGRGRLADVPALAMALAGAYGSVIRRSDGVRQLGVGSIQDALNEVAAAREARTGVPASFRVNLGADNVNRGLFGPGTQAAVRAFQTDRALPVTGEVDAAMLVALETSLASSRTVNSRFTGVAFDGVARGVEIVRVGSPSRAVVVALQQALLDMGFSLGPHPGPNALSPEIDGAFGNRTATALRNFQVHAHKRFPEVLATGALDAATLRALHVLAPALGATAWTAGQPRHAPEPRWEGATLVRAVMVSDEHRTFFYDEAGNLERIFSNAVGTPDSPTHEGLRRIVTRMNEAMSQAAGEDLWGNPLTFGTRMLNLSWAGGSSSGEEMHGTYTYGSIGTDASHGCIRHYNRDIEYMFTRVAVGEMVAVVDSINAREVAPPGMAVVV